MKKNNSVNNSIVDTFQSIKIANVYKCTYGTEYQTFLTVAESN